MGETLPPDVDAVCVAVDGLLAGVGTLGLTASSAQVRLVLAEVVRQQSRLDAARLRLVQASVEADAREGSSGSGARRVVGTVAYLAETLHQGRPRAHADVRAAALLDPDAGDLRELGDALAVGVTSGEHVRVAVSALTRIPTAIRRERRQDIAEYLTGNATTYDPGAAGQLSKHLLAYLCPDATDRFDPLAYERRSLRTATDSTGMVISRGQHDPVAGAFLVAALDAIADVDRPVQPCGDAEQPQPQRGAADVRTRPMRHHDALHDIVRAGIEALSRGDVTGRIGAALARITIVTTPDQLAHVPTANTDGTDTHADRTGEAEETDENDATAKHSGAASPRAAAIVGQGPVSSAVIQRLACDAVRDLVVRDAHGAVVSMTSAGRLATAAQRRALVARDGGCAFPGCARPPSVCDAHHVVWWSRRGPTTVGNMTLLCSHHHTLVHTTDWLVEMRDGIPWFRPPDQTRWYRGTFTDAVERTRRFADALRRGLPTDGSAA